MQTLTLRVVTWNIVNLLISASAEPEWTQKEQEQAIVTILKQRSADCIALQEVPSGKYIQYLQSAFPDFNFSKAALTHAGYSLLMVKNSITILHQQLIGPAILCECNYENTRFFISSAHLMPFKDSKSKRFLQVSNILQEIATTKTIPVILLGDMNMREEETESICEQLDVVDAFLLLSKEEAGKSKYTWDSFLNRYYAKNIQFRARFDRIFLRHCISSNFYLMANSPVTNNHHFLSDHFGIYAEITLNT